MTEFVRHSLLALTMLLLCVFASACAGKSDENKADTIALQPQAVEAIADDTADNGTDDMSSASDDEADDTNLIEVIDID